MIAEFVAILRDEGEHGAELPPRWRTSWPDSIPRRHAGLSGADLLAELAALIEPAR